MQYFPVIDLSGLNGRDSNSNLSIGEQICDAAHSYGFFYVKNHGVSEELLESVFDTAQKFFSLPVHEKSEVTISKFHRGFLGIGASTMEGYSEADRKESYIWGLDVEPDESHTQDAKKLLAENRWPNSMPEMPAVLNDYFHSVHNCAFRILEAAAEFLGQDRDFFSRNFNRPTSRGSMIYYPPDSESKGEYGVSPHTDFGCLSILAQRSSGLRVKSKDGEWHRADPIPGTFVVNVGDLLSRWTNDRFSSVSHCVVNENTDARYSVVVFVDPDTQTVIDPILTQGETANYEPIDCDTYITRRFDRSFAYRN